ncbi:alpha/beta hydrolase [Pusillimonas harenae]|uniref:Alpha/beta hydrolase n=2 Tax=Pollutimonas harenae TaxID=657015 RepID=A0A853GZM3_9BURK|nr:alpha/beta hydrolase [Pollutimonas harenae]TEA71551.1 alpha/beta hydrolase [Pollutimonas harenae]
MRIKFLLLGLCCLIGTAHAQVQETAPAGPHVRLETVADHPSALYQFEQHHMVSEDGQRNYRIDIAIPHKREPNAGYPVLYMLDGNSAMAMLTEQDLTILSGENPPVLVAIGYDTPGRLDVNARSYDYTPPIFENGKQVQAPTVRGRVGGGADIFLQFIATHIKPLVRARANIDSRREYLWGHSYGGLFALHTLFTQPNAFARYIVGDPSAWWYNGALMDEWRSFDTERAVGKRVAILIGTKPRASAKTKRKPSRSSQKNELSAYVRDAGREIAEGLRQAGIDASYQIFPEYGHGEMSRVSLERALQIATAP